MASIGLHGSTLRIERPVARSSIPPSSRTSRRRIGRSSTCRGSVPWDSVGWSKHKLSCCASSYPTAAVSRWARSPSDSTRPRSPPWIAILVELDLRRCFAVVSDSAILGVEKPHPRIFVETLARLQTPPERAWMVGDNLETDIRPAGALGMRTCWLAPLDRPAPSGVVPTKRIARLPEVEAALRETDAPRGTGACTA